MDEPPTRGGRTTEYWPALDGLRGVAIIAVVLYHARLPSNAGGFIGVDVFFVLSGFLITRLLVAERSRSGTISLPAFYARRALRLLPALLAVVAACWVWATVFATGELRANTLTGVPASLFYFGNWWTAFSGKYLGALGHTWSLSVEEQFYLLWPVLLVTVLSIVRSRRVLVAALAAAAVGVALHRADVWHGPQSFFRVYFSFDTNADFLLVGCIVGLTARQIASAIRRRALQAAALAGAVWVVAMMAITKIDSAFYYRWGAPSIAVATALVLWSVVDRPSKPLARVLESRPLVFTGRISYSMYLWHLPILIVLWTGSLHGETRVAAEIGRLVLIVLVSVASYRLIEQPFLRLKHRFSRVEGGATLETPTGLPTTNSPVLVPASS